MKFAPFAASGYPYDRNQTQNIMPNNAPSKDSTLRAIPSVDQLLRTEEGSLLRTSVGLPRLTAIAREVTEEMRRQIQSEELPETTKDELRKEAVERMRSLCRRESLSGVRRVINATGVILHTNLGRAPLSEAARHAVAVEVAGYCTLEYDASTGSRGKRGGHSSEY